MIEPTSTAYASAAATANLAALRAAFATTCAHSAGCTNRATHQTTRPATPEEAEAHWAATEQNIRAANDGRPEVGYVADRTDSVTIAVHLCDDPQHADPAYLEAKAREEEADG